MTFVGQSRTMLCAPSSKAAPAALIVSPASGWQAVTRTHSSTARRERRRSCCHSGGWMAYLPGAVAVGDAAAASGAAAGWAERLRPSPGAMHWAIRSAQSPSCTTSQASLLPAALILASALMCDSRPRQRSLIRTLRDKAAAAPRPLGPPCGRWKVDGEISSCGRPSGPHAAWLSSCTIRS